MEDSALHEKLDELLEIAEENNTLLKKMRRDARNGLIIKALFWVVVIGVSTYLGVQVVNPLLSGGAAGAELQKVLGK